MSSLPIETVELMFHCEDLRLLCENDSFLGDLLDFWEADELAERLLACQPSLTTASVEIVVDLYTPNQATRRRPSSGPLVYETMWQYW